MSRLESSSKTVTESSCSRVSQVKLETQRSGPNLLVVLISLVVDDVEELELVDATRGRDDAEPVTELLLLEELLGPVYPMVC